MGTSPSQDRSSPRPPGGLHHPLASSIHARCAICACLFHSPVLADPDGHPSVPPPRQSHTGQASCGHSLPPFLPASPVLTILTNLVLGYSLASSPRHWLRMAQSGTAALYRWHTTHTPSPALVTLATNSLPRISSRVPKRGRARTVFSSSSRLRLGPGKSGRHRRWGRSCDLRPHSLKQAGCRPPTHGHACTCALKEPVSGSQLLSSPCILFHAQPPAHNHLYSSMNRSSANSSSSSSSSSSSLVSRKAASFRWSSSVA